ncbi:MAG TPA: redox-regulated ATPase YchF, partial [Methanomicrobiales archaeon]|nr:redox-regulated ATPase YchF [Methanomicrobiales archaeon]
ALAGKPNCGKSTFFKAATLANVEIANYPFTTIDANHGVAYVRSPCVCRELGTSCGVCKDGVRFVPIGLIDVAGLVPEAHKGRGLGNQFLDHLRQADAILHLLDASGSTDAEGNPVGAGTHDPAEDIEFLEFEMSMWLYGILEKHWTKIQRQSQAKSSSMVIAIAELLAGLGITAEQVHAVELESGIDLPKAGEPELARFSRMLLTRAKPMMIVGNRVDEAADAAVGKLREKGVRFATAAGELALRNAATAGIVKYLPGDPSFSVTKPGGLNPAQKAGLERIAGVMKKFGGTGVQEALNQAVFSLLDLIVVYPVEDEHKFSDSQGRVLPDAFLMKKGSTPRDLAFRVHTDIGEGFLYAVDARTKMRVKDTHPLKDRDVIKIVSTRR